MNKKWMCGLTALVFFASVAMADYPLFKAGGSDGAYTNPTNAWGGNIMGFGYNKVTTGNAVPDPNPTGNGLDVFDPADGVAKLKNVNFENATYAGAFISLSAEAATTQKPSDCTNGFSYKYKGNAPHTFILQFSSTECTTEPFEYGNQWKKENIPAAASFTEITYTLNDFGGNDEGGCGIAVQKTLSKVVQLSWGFSRDDAAATDLNLEISEVSCLTAGGNVDPCIANPTLPQCGNPIMLPNGTVVSGLNVVPFARSLHITSGKDATVSLFDMHGKQVFSKKVLAGERVVSLENQRQGVYYAVVRSGSLKQTVKVVLK